MDEHTNTLKQAASTQHATLYRYCINTPLSPSLSDTDKQTNNINRGERKMNMMSLIQFLEYIPAELRFQILHTAGAQAAANVSITCRAAFQLIQKDDYLWKALFQRDLSDITSLITYPEYHRFAVSHSVNTSAYAWYWHVFTCCCTVCFWYIPHKGGIIRRSGIEMCRDCERDLEDCQKIYDV